MRCKTLAFLLVTFLAVVPARSQASQAAPPPDSVKQDAPKPAAAPAPAAQSAPVTEEEMGRLYLIRKQPKEAADTFHRLTVEHPKNALYWNEYGIALHNMGDLQSALRCYEKAAKLDKHYADAQNNIGTIWYERKRYPKAIRAYDRAIAMRADYAPFYLNLGYAYFAQNEYDNSISAFRQALKIDPLIFEPGHAKGGTVVQDRSIASDRGSFYFLLAKSFAETGNTERCLAYLKKAKEEGYQDIAKAKTDPSFAVMMKDPAFQEFFEEKPPDQVQQP
jgi:tetratricopeptide (TPR) repeat protein